MKKMFETKGKLNRIAFFKQTVISACIFALSAYVPTVIGAYANDTKNPYLIIIAGVLSLLLFVIGGILLWRQNALLSRRLNDIGWDSEYAIIITVSFLVAGAMMLSDALSKVAGILFVFLCLGYCVFFLKKGKETDSLKGGENDERA